jgi:ABC-2 type transport system permease protein
MSEFYTVFKKELEDHFTSWRFILLFALVLLVGLASIYTAAGTIREQTQGITGNNAYFLTIFTISSETLRFSFVNFITLLLPLIAIALGLDAINSEKNNGTLSGLLSQPVYRDSIINAKFAAGVVTISVTMISIVLLVSGLGLRLIGVPPGSEEVWRLFFFVLSSIIYGAFWLALSILFSILFRRVATSTLFSLAIWVVFFFFFGLVGTYVANWLHPVIANDINSAITNQHIKDVINRFSPMGLFEESTLFLLFPLMKTQSQLMQIYYGASDFYLANPLSMGQSMIAVWPHLVTLVLITLFCFAFSYIKFMREEIRST